MPNIFGDPAVTEVTPASPEQPTNVFGDPATAAPAPSPQQPRVNAFGDPAIPQAPVLSPEAQRQEQVRQANAARGPIASNIIELLHPSAELYAQYIEKPVASAVGLVAPQAAQNILQNAQQLQETRGSEGEGFLGQAARLPGQLLGQLPTFSNPAAAALSGGTQAYTDIEAQKAAGANIGGVSEVVNVAGKAAIDAVLSKVFSAKPYDPGIAGNAEKLVGAYITKYVGPYVARYGAKAAVGALANDAATLASNVLERETVNPNQSITAGLGASTAIGAGIPLLHEAGSETLKHFRGNATPDQPVSAPAGTTAPGMPIEQAKALLENFVVKSREGETKGQPIEFPSIEEKAKHIASRTDFRGPVVEAAKAINAAPAEEPAAKFFREAKPAGEPMSHETVTKGQYTILTAENPDAKPLSPEDNAARNEQLRADLKGMGVRVQEIQGHYGGNAENSFMVEGLTREQSLALAEKYGQQSVLRSDEGLVYRDGRVVPRSGDVITGDEAIKTGNFSVANVAGEKTAFSVPLDFSKEATPTEHGPAAFEAGPTEGHPETEARMASAGEVPPESPETKLSVRPPETGPVHEMSFDSPGVARELAEHRAANTGKSHFLSADAEGKYHVDQRNPGKGAIEVKPDGTYVPVTEEPAVTPPAEGERRGVVRSVGDVEVKKAVDDYRDDEETSTKRGGGRPRTMEQAKAANSMRDAIGARVVWYEGTGLGFADKAHPGVLFLNDKLSGKQLVNTLAHELMHNLALLRPGLFNDFLNAIPEDMRDSTIARYMERWNAAGMEGKPNRINEEAATMPFGDMAESQGIMRKIAGENPTLMDRIVRTLRELAAKLGHTKSQVWLEAMKVWEKLLDAPLTGEAKASPQSVAAMPAKIPPTDYGYLWTKEKGLVPVPTEGHMAAARDAGFRSTADAMSGGAIRMTDIPREGRLGIAVNEEGLKNLDNVKPLMRKSLREGKAVVVDYFDGKETRYTYINSPKDIESKLSSLTSDSGIAFAPGDRAKANQEKAVKELNPEDKAIWDKLLPEEQSWATAPGVKKMVQAYKDIKATIPSEQWQASMRAGRSMSKWYQRATASIKEIFGQDAPLFTSLLAADSPRQKVSKNLNESLRTWQAWDKAGRPSDPAEIRKIAEKEVNLSTRIPNIVRALTGEYLSGPKVNSFMQNLLGNLTFSTNDTWMGQFAGMGSEFFQDTHNYLGFSAALRDEAKVGKMEPAEAQAAIWSFFSVLANRVNSTTLGRDVLQSLSEEHVSNANAFDFIADPAARQSLLESGVTEDTLQRAAKAAAGIVAVEDASATISPEDKATLAPIADRAEQLAKHPPNYEKISKREAELGGGQFSELQLPERTPPAGSEIAFRPGEPKSFEEQKYPHEQDVVVRFPDGSVHMDTVKGLNEGHALSRARENWPGAHVEPARHSASFRPGGVYDEEVKPRLKKLTDFFSEFGDAFRTTFRPGGSDTGAKETKGIFKENMARFDLAQRKAEDAFESARRGFEKMDQPDQWDFQRRMDEQGKQATPELQDIADAMYADTNEGRKSLEKAGVDAAKNWQEEWWNRLWKKDPEAAAKMRDRFGGPGKIEGRAGFLKGRTVEAWGDALDQGLVPKFDNPVDMFLATKAERNRYLAALSSLQEMADQGTVMRFRGTIPDGWTELPNSAKGPLKNILPAGQGGTPGTLAAPTPIAEVVRNVVTPSAIGNTAAFRLLQGVNNTLTQAALAISGFHIFKVATEGVNLQLARAAELASKGETGASLGAVGHALIAPIESLFRGRDIQKKMLGQLVPTPEEANVIDGMIRGGMRAKSDPVYETQWRRRFQQGMDRGGLSGLVRMGINAIPAANEALMQKTVFSYVQAAKLFYAFEQASDVSRRLGPSPDVYKLRDEMGKVSDHLDNVLGLMVRDNLFWNRTARDIATLATLSVGWNYGSLRALGKGGFEAAKMPVDLLQGKSIKDLNTRSISYIATTAILQATAGAALTYMATGKAPQSLTDYIYPKTGKKDASGRDVRIRLPFYTSDWFDFMEHPVQTAANKSSPIVSAASELYSNKDYYGTKIRNEDDPWYQQAYDIADYLAGKGKPFSVKQLQDTIAGKGPAASTGMGILPFVGIRTAAKKYSYTDAEERLHEIAAQSEPIGGRTKEAAARTSKVYDVVAAFRAKDPTARQQLSDAMKSGALTQSDAQRVKELVENPPSLVSSLKTGSLGPEQIMSIWDRMTPEEKKSTGAVVLGKLRGSKAVSRDKLRAYADQVTKETRAP